jgi:undecaprenyl-diphosphatase
VKRGDVAIGGFAVLFAGAVGLAVAAAAWDRWPGDVAITREVQGWPQPVRAISDALRAVTGTEVVVVAGLVLAAGLVVVGRRWRLAAGYAVLFVALPLVQWGVKRLVDRPRPPEELVEVRAVGTSPSFPAGHVMSGTVLVCTLVALVWAAPVGWTWKWTATAAGAAVVAAGGVANVHVGAHWPSDVLGGLAWAAVLLAATGWGVRWLGRHVRGRGQPPVLHR